MQELPIRLPASRCRYCLHLPLCSAIWLPFFCLHRFSGSPVHLRGEFIEFAAELGISVPYSDNSNASDVALDMIAAATEPQLEALHGRTLRQLGESEHRSLTAFASHSLGTRICMVPWHVQVLAVAGRLGLHHVREPNLLVLHTIVAIVMGLLVGSVYNGVDNTIAGIQVRHVNVIMRTINLTFSLSAFSLCCRIEWVFLSSLALFSRRSRCPRWMCS